MVAALRREQGAAYLLLMLLILALAASVLGLNILKQTVRAGESDTTTTSRLVELEKVMARFVAANRRLPCAADGRIATGTANAGVEARNANGDCTAANFGVVPWITLQISEADAQDGWNNRLTYRVPTGATGFTRNLAFDMSACSATGTAGTTTTGGATSAVICFARVFPCPIPAACTSPTNYVLNRGIAVRDTAGTTIMNPATGSGAAYVVISAGANLGGAYDSSGNIVTAKGGALGTNESTNQNNQALQAFYVDGLRNTATGAAHFDDVALRPGISTVLAAAQLGPRP